MPTIQQLVRQGRVLNKKRSKSADLDASPQKRGVCLRVFTTTPKKPNSELQKVALARTRIQLKGQIPLHVELRCRRDKGHYKLRLVGDRDGV